MLDTAEEMVKTLGAFDDLDGELDRFEKSLEALDVQLRSRTERLRDLVGRLDQIRADIDL